MFCSYLFIRPKQKKYENIHDYWKGLVLEIKTYPKKEALVKVAWYWSKKDILHKLESEKVEIDEELSLFVFQTLCLKFQSL